MKRVDEVKAKKAVINAERHKAIHKIMDLDLKFNTNWHDVMTSRYYVRIQNA